MMNSSGAGPIFVFHPFGKKNFLKFIHFENKVSFNGNGTLI